MLPELREERGEIKEKETTSIKNLSLSSQQNKRWKRIIREETTESSGEKEEDNLVLKRKHDVVATMETEDGENALKRRDTLSIDQTVEAVKQARRQQ